MSVGLLLAIGAGVFIVYLVMRSSSGSGDDSAKSNAPSTGTKSGSSRGVPRPAAAASSPSATKSAPKTDGDLTIEYQSLMAELGGVFQEGGTVKPAKGDMAKLQRLGRVAETPALKGVVDKAAVVSLLESGMAWIDGVYGAGNATGKTRLEAFEKSAKKLQPRKKKATSASVSAPKAPLTGRFGLPFDVEAFAAHFPEGWVLVDEKKDEWILNGPEGAQIGVGPHQLKPSSDLFDIVESYTTHFDAHEPIESFLTSIGTRGWAVVVTEDGVSHLM